jgi:hypothetical protein
MTWRWVNEQRLTWELDQCPEDQLDALLDALDMVLADPMNPALTSCLRGNLDAGDRYVAPLPYGWVLVFTPRPDGVPPTTVDPVLVVRSMYRMFDH